MTDAAHDARLIALLAETAPSPDPAFSDRIIALARHDLAMRQSRRRSLGRVGIETAALAAVITAFALLSRSAPDPAGFGDTIGLANPALLGLAMLAMWTVAAVRPVAGGR